MTPVDVSNTINLKITAMSGGIVDAITGLLADQIIAAFLALIVIALMLSAFKWLVEIINTPIASSNRDDDYMDHELEENTRSLYGGYEAQFDEENPEYARRKIQPLTPSEKASYNYD